MLLMHCCTSQSHHSSMSSTKKDSHKFLQFFVAMSPLILFQMLICIINGVLLLLLLLLLSSCFPLNLPPRQLQFLVHTCPCLIIPRISRSIQWDVFQTSQNQFNCTSCYLFHFLYHQNKQLLIDMWNTLIMFCVRWLKCFKTWIYHNK